MTDLTGDGVLALWNGVEPSRQREYDAWHTREHVPERLAVPGMRGARRYVRLSGPLPEYFTLYALNDTGVLTSAPYRKLLDNPTEWSQSMRPFFRGFMRLACHRVLSLGGGMGCVLAAMVVDESVDLRSASLKQEFEALLKAPGLVAIHVLQRDRDIPDVPFKIGGHTPDFPNAGAILLEGHDESELNSAIRAAGLVAARPADTMTTYRLAYALDRASLDRVVTMAQNDFS